MADQDREPPHGLDDHALLRSIHEGTASETGERVFATLVEHLCLALRANSAWVTQVLPAGRLRVLACWRVGQKVPSWEYDVAGTPCGQVIDRGLPVHVAEGVRAQYPDDRSLRDRGAVGYVGCRMSCGRRRWCASSPPAPRRSCNACAPSRRCSRRRPSSAG